MNENTCTIINQVWSELCEYRLPCGICRITENQCPKIPVTIEPTWTSAITNR